MCTTFCLIGVLKLLETDMVHILDQENVALAHPMFAVKVREALWLLRKDKIFGLDGSLSLFFCCYWLIIKRRWSR